MSNDEDQIQAGLPTPAHGDAVESPWPEETWHPYRTRWAGAGFGAFAGIPLGTVVAAICCWLADFGDYALDGALIGVGAGLVGGAIIGYLERTIRGDLAKPDIATFVGALFGILVAVVLLLGFPVVVVGWVVAGLLCVGPMAGLLFGAMLDRAYDASTQGHWLSAAGFGLFAIAASGGIVVLVAERSDPDPAEVAKEARTLIANQPEMKDVKIHKIILDPPKHRTYRGTMEATVGGQMVQFDIEVYIRHDLVKAKWFPR